MNTKHTPSQTDEILKSNPTWTYGMAVGYGIGLAAKAMDQRFAGLSEDDWRNAGDDYACGYRKAFNESHS